MCKRSHMIGLLVLLYNKISQAQQFINFRNLFLTVLEQEVRDQDACIVRFCV